MYLRLSFKEYEIIKQWYNVACGEVNLDKEDEKLMLRLDELFGNP